MNIFTRNMNFVKFNNQNMEWVKFNGVTVYEAWKKLIVSGVPPLSLVKCKGTNLVDYKIYGNSIQDGTPTPEAPVEIESVGDKSKNLFDYVYFFANKAEGGGTSSSSNDALVYTLKPNTNYIVSTNYPQKENVAVFFTKSGTYTPPYTPENGIWEGKTRIVTTDRNGKMFIACRNSKSSVPVPLLEEFSSGGYWIQIEEGSVPTSFEPYGYKIPIKLTKENGESETTNIYLNEPLRKIGDYSDYIDFENQKVYRKIYQDRLSNLEFIGKSGIKTSNNYYASYSYESGGLNAKPVVILSDYSTYGLLGGILCEKLPNIKWSSIRDNNNIFGIVVTEANSKKSNEIRVCVPTDEATTLDEFKIWQANNDCNIYYVMLNPTEEDIELPNIPTFKGTTIIEVDTEIQPSNMEVTYIGK